MNVAPTGKPEDSRRVLYFIDADGTYKVGYSAPRYKGSFRSSKKSSDGKGFITWVGTVAYSIVRPRTAAVAVSAEFLVDGSD